MPYFRGGKSIIENVERGIEVSVIRNPYSMVKVKEDVALWEEKAKGKLYSGEVQSLVKCFEIFEYISGRQLISSFAISLG